MNIFKHLSGRMLAALVLSLVLGMSVVTVRADDNSLTVAQVRNMQDDSSVIMHGYIVERLDTNDYVFRDDSGQINLKVNDGQWFEEDTGATQRVEVRGKLQRGPEKHEQVLVDSIRKY